MQNLDKFPAFFDEEVKIAAYCPLCDADLNPIKARIIEEKNDLYLVHIQCDKCKGFVLALVLRTENGLTSIGLITDLNFNDVYKFKNKDKISADEIIKLHKNFNKRNLVKEILGTNKITNN